MNTTTTAYEFYCVLGSGEESILAVIEGRGETEIDRLRDAEREAAEADIGRGHGPVMARPAKKVVSNDEYAAARERVSTARATRSAVIEEIRLASTQPPSLLSLYNRAISLRRASRAAWAKVDAYRSEHSASGYDWGNTGGEAERAEDDALCAAFHAAEKAEHDSIADLCAAVRAAEWGQQPDGSFVSRSAVTCGGFQQHHTLHAPAKQGPLCEVRDHERGPGSCLSPLRTREEAYDIAIAQRCDNRDKERIYAGLRRRAGDWLRCGAPLPFCPGQNYGTVKIHDRYVSARGALVAAGMTGGDALDLLSTCEGDGMLTLSGLTGEPYPTPREW